MRSSFLCELLSVNIINEPHSAGPVSLFISGKASEAKKHKHDQGAADFPEIHPKQLHK